jgi:phosphohistidine phosphatase
MTQPKTRTLWLIRHAKAVSPAFAQRDFDRELAPSGQADVDDLVAYCMNHDMAAASWLWVSPAARTQQTAAPLAQLWRSQVIEEASLYLADAYTLLDCLQGTPSSEACVGMVGHNPGISALLHLLQQSDTDTAPFEELPTLGATRLTFTGSWQDLAPNICTLTSYLSPKRIKQKR